MALEEKQRSFRGLTFGAGTDIRLVSEEGLEEITVRDGDREIPRGDGGIPGQHPRDMRAIVLKLIVRGDDVPGTTRDIRRAFTPDGTTDQFQYVFRNQGETEDRFVWARPLRYSVSRNTDNAVGNHMPVTVAAKLADPRVYSVAQEHELVPVFEATGGGFDLAVDLPFSMQVASQELGTAINDGSTNAYPVVQFQYVSGTVSGVELTNLTTGVSLDIDTTLVAGQTLTADMDALIRATGGPVVHIVGVSRYGDWVPPRDPFYLRKGSNTLRFEVTGGGDVVCSVSWRHTD